MKHTGPPKPNTSLSEAVLEAVATEMGVEQSDLPDPLFDAIDPEALDRLFRPDRNGQPTRDGHITFTYAGYEVTTYSDKRVELLPLEQS